jgi:hypothetical protein
MNAPRKETNMGIYANLEQFDKGSSQSVTYSATELAKTVGGKIMKAVESQRIVANGVISEANMKLLMVNFRHQLKVAGWKWFPPKAGQQGGKVLDGDVTEGECAYLAKAFQLILNLPDPAGCQVNAEAEFVSYSGVGGAGFIADHPGDEFGLSHNMTMAVDNHRKTYNWDNHKVVKYGGKYYDVCYNNVYSQLSDMALVVLQDKKERKGVGPAYTQGPMVGQIGDIAIYKGVATNHTYAGYYYEWFDGLKTQMTGPHDSAIPDDVIKRLLDRKLFA